MNRIAVWDGSRLIVDGCAIKWIPRGKQAKNEVWYLVGRQPWSVIASGLFRAGDVLYGKRRGEPESAQPKEGPRMVSGDSWGLPSDPIEAAAELSRLKDETASEGIAWAKTAAGAAGPLMDSFSPEIAETACTAPRWRRIAHRAIHSGPCVLVQASHANAVQMDQKQAYLRGLRSAVPVPGTHRSDLAPWTRLRKKDGIITASVHVPDIGWPIGPLPIDAGGLLPAVGWPTGTVYGSWPISWLRWAEEIAKCKVLAVHDAVTWTASKLFEMAADKIESIKDKPLRRMIYTRAVGRMASGGRWIGTVVPHPKVSGKIAVEWARTPKDADSPMPRWYRPDIAGVILADTAVRTVAAAACWGAACAHVDAVWVPAGSVTDAPEWAEKGAGAFRGYAVGTYTHGNSWGAQGIYGIKNGAHLRAVMNERKAIGIETLFGRNWTGNPMIDPNATSATVSDRYERARIDPPTWDGSQWSSGGYRKKDAPDLPFYAVRSESEKANGMPCFSDSKKEIEKNQVRDIFDVDV